MRSRRLIVCLSDPDEGPRPTEFSAQKGSKRMLMVLKRVPPTEKSKKPDSEPANTQPTTGTGIAAKVVTDAEVTKLLQLTQPQYMHSLDDSSGGSLVRDILKVSLAMRRLGLDAVIDCELFSRVSALLSFTTGAPVRVGFTPHTQEGLYRGSFINHAIPYNPYQHISKQFLSLVDALDSAGSMPRNKAAPIRSLPRDTELSVAFTQDELAAYAAKLVTARFYAESVLPTAYGLATSVVVGGDTIAQAPVDMF